MEDVWDFVTSDDTWREPFIQGVRQVSGSGLEEGARYENVASAGPISFTLINEIIEVEPERRLTWRDVTPKPGPLRTIEGSYILEPADGGTDFTLKLHSETRGLPAGAAKFFTKTFIAPKLLAQLEKGLEGDSVS